MYLQTARLDLDDYNNDTEDGLHITSMGGTWLAFVIGMGGMRVQNNQLQFNPILPKSWTAYSFKINFRGALLKIEVNKTKIEVSNLSDQEVSIKIFENQQTLNKHSKLYV